MSTPLGPGERVCPYTKLNVIEERGDAKGKGRVSILNVIPVLLDHVSEDLNRARYEVKLIADNAQSQMRARTFDPKNSTDVLVWFFSGPCETLLKECADSYYAESGMPLTLKLVYSIVLTWQLCGAYGISMAAYQDSRLRVERGGKARFMQVSWACSAEQSSW